jgi:hypothetical protein
MTKISVSSRICGTKHIIKGRVEGNRIIIEIDTPCEKFRDFACLEIPVQELSDSEINLTAEMEKQINCSLECTKECALDCTGQCLIPTAVLNVCCIEKELAEAKLIKTTFLEVAEFTASELE